MSTEAIDPTAAREQLAAEAARHRINERRLARAIYQAANHAGLSQREISDNVGIHSQATIQRILHRLTKNPSLLDETPAEIIDHRTVEVISDHDMMERLMNWTYSFGGVERLEDVATDAYTPGDWDDIEMAFYRGLLSHDEFQTLATRQLKST